MPKKEVVLASALPVLWLAACGSPEPTSAQNKVAETGAPDKASPSDPGQPSGPQEPGVGSVPTPDSVSDPGGGLANAGDVPEPSAPEPATDGPPGSKEPPPTTEDEYIRNKVGG